MTEEIQLFKPTYRTEECLKEIEECLKRGWTGLGFKTVQFEDAWKAYTGLPHAHFLASNTVGLHLALHILKTRMGWKDGDEVITTPLTFVSTNHAILYERLTPVFADVDEHLCLDPKDIEKKITRRTRAVLFVGMGGNSGRYDKALSLCRKHKLAMVLDAAHMAGTRTGGRHVGHDADAAVFSFQAVKNLPTADSGMICFADPLDDERVRKLAWLGINKDTYARTTSAGAYKWKYDVEEVGFKYHGNSIMAAIGLVQLRYLDHDNAYRRQLSAWYREELAGFRKAKTVPVPKGCESASHLFQVIVNRRDELMLALNENKIYPGVHYRDNTEYRMFAKGKGTCPRAHKASDELLSLPLHMQMTRHHVDHICRTIRKHAR